MSWPLEVALVTGWAVAAMAVASVVETLGGGTAAMVAEGAATAVTAAVAALAGSRSSACSTTMRTC